jgi:hypothetical protein
LNGNISGINNLSLLEEENTSLNSSLKIGSDLERHAMSINDELNDQKNYLDKIKDKVHRIYHKLQVSNSITHFLVRRGRGDTFLCIFMGILTIIIIYFCLYHLKPKIRGTQHNSISK